MARPLRTPQSYAALGLLGVMVLGLPLLRGGVDFPTIAVEVALCLVAAALALSSTAKVPLAAVLLSGAILVCTVQLFPIPAQLHRISPLARQVFETSLQPLGLYPGARPLSLDPAATALELAEAVGFVAAFLAAWTYSGSRQRFGLLASALGLSGVVVSAVVLVAALAGVGPVVEPRFPFVNPNHLAGFTDLTAFVALGLALHARGPERLLWLIGFALIAAVGLLSLSRSGFGGLVVGLGAFAFLHVRRRRASAGPPARWGLAAALTTAVAVALGIAVYLASDALLGELRTLRTVADEAKPQLWLIGLRVVRDAPWTGIGRGAFPLVFAAYKTDPARFTFTHVENEWLQMVIDLGLPLGLLVVGTLAWTWLAAARRPAATAIHVGLLAGTAAVACHDLADFSLDIAGVAIPFAVALGLLAQPSHAVWLRPRLLRGALALGGALALSGLAVGWTFGVQRMADPLETADASAVAVAAREVVSWHPADYLPHAVAGARLVAADRCGEGIPWLDRAMLLNPTEPLPHRFAGRCFARAGRAALARREYRLALAYGDRDSLGEAVASFPTLEALYDVVPDTPGDLVALGDLLAGSRPADAAAVYERALGEEPDRRTIASLGRLRLRLGEPERALALAQQLISDRADDAQGYVLAHAALVALERPREAEAVVERGLEAEPGSFDLLGIQYSAAIARHRYGEAKQIAERIAPKSRSELSMKDLAAAGAMAAQGRYPEAIERARMASDEDPSSPGALYQLAELQAAAGRYQDAIDALEQAAELPGGDRDRCRRRTAELRAAAAAQVTTELRGPGATPGDEAKPRPGGSP